jgi:hypothetical protein
MRKGLGLHKGRGYKNLIPIDHHIHSLSAKGVKTYAKGVNPHSDRHTRWDSKTHFTEGDYVEKIYPDKTGHNLQGIVISDLSPKWQIVQFYGDVEEIPSWKLRKLNAKNIYRKHSSFGFDSSEIDKEVERLKKESVMRRKLILEGKLNAKHFDSRIMWNPRTKKMISGDTTHDAILQSNKQNLNKFNEWVRGLYDEENKTLYVRQYFNPKSLYSEFTAKDFEISEKMQKKFVEQIHLPKDVKVVYNSTNEMLRQEGYIHS